MVLHYFSCKEDQNFRSTYFLLSKLRKLNK
nr:MAG TPA: hypothetical protein [Caudoviricetes sp.]DAT46858.1 MAG TPA: hypothetical protein [Caudoviricetes sp.]DAV13942.1 MAG TPA: hypothetical protein [Caudoviricetes sp.]